MIRNLVVAFVTIVFTAVPMSSALAAPYSGPGCGLGKMVWNDNTKLIPQVLAATTNGTSGNQTFGMTSGTSGCSNDGLVKNDQKVFVFASVNLDNLSQEMAQGRGEHLSALANLIGVPADRQASFAAMTQEKYTSLFKSETTTSHEMLTALNQELEAQPALLQVATR